MKATAYSLQEKMKHISIYKCLTWCDKILISTYIINSQQYRANWQIPTKVFGMPPLDF